MRIYLNKHRNALCKAPRPDGKKLGQTLRIKFNAAKSCMTQLQVISSNSSLKEKYYVS
jgi:hypothetical protein